jgi:small subunit ribosomal protein S17
MTEAQQDTTDPTSRAPSKHHRRRERTGVVVSDAMRKTVVVRVEQVYRHPQYEKVVRRSRKFYAHDEAEAAHVGDTVRIRETRPLSKLKRWQVVEVVKTAPMAAETLQTEAAGSEPGA